MPIYEYRARDQKHACPQCAGGFEWIQSLHDPPLATCPKCGAPVEKLISPPAIGKSGASLDDRARNAGFHKLKRLGKGEYEKQY